MTGVKESPNVHREIDNAARKLCFTLNAGQQQALVEMLESIAFRRPHLLTGDAGTGKTVVVQVLAVILLRRRLKFVPTAPTHKAVAVIAAKLKKMRIDVQPITIHSLLALRPKPHGDRLVFDRKEFAPPVMADVVAIDEGSMLGADLMRHIALWLPNSVVLYVADEAQLPPVGEPRSSCFDTPNRSHLAEPVRQAKDSPVLAAAWAIRAQQGGPLDWGWLKQVTNGKRGVYLPGARANDWMQKAFTSPDYDANPDRFRFLAWTNAKVHATNAKIRRWRYGETSTPFVADERALLRSPVINDDTILANANEEPLVLSISAAEIPAYFDGEKFGTIETWRVRMRNDDGLEFDANLVRNERGYKDALNRFAQAANRRRELWKDFHAFKQQFVEAQSIYSMTVHCAQGSTHTVDFVDIGDIARRAETNLLEMQQLLYVAMSRPTDIAAAVGL